MPMNKKLALLLVVAAIGLAFLGSRLFSVTAGTPPTCTFTETNKTCVVPYSLASERAADTVTFDFDFAPVPDTALIGTQTVTSTSTWSFTKPSSSSKTYNTYYMYSVPNWEDPYDIVIKATGTHSVYCSAFSSTSRTYISANAVTRPWSGNTIVVNRREDEINNPALTNVTLMMTDNRYTYPTFYERNQFTIGGFQTARCYRSSSDPVESFTNPYTLDVVIPNAYVYPPSDTRFLIRTYKDLEGSVTATLDTPQVTVGYHRALYPSNVNYKVGRLNIETFSGIRKNTTASLDIADQINLECNRGLSSAACTVNITITSDTPGLLWFTKTGEILKVASQDAVIADLQSDLATKIAYIDALNASIEEKARIIEQLSVTQAEQVAMIDSLNLNIADQARVVNELSANVEEKASLIAALTSKQEEQAALIEALNLNIADQAAVINELTSNLAVKAAFVEQLQAENSQQAALIAAMEQSFTNQGAIIAGLQNTVQDDAALITQLTSDNAAQAEIIKGLNVSYKDEGGIIAALNKTVEEDAALINELTTDNNAQAQIIAGMSASLEREQALVAELRATVDEQNALIDQINKEKQGATAFALFVGGLAVVAIIGAVVYARRKK